MSDKNKKTGWSISNIVGFGVIFLLIQLGMGFNNLDSFIDMPSIQFVLGITIAAGFFIASKKTMHDLQVVITGKKEFKSYSEAKVFIDLLNSLSRVSIAAGILGTMIGIILMLGNLSEVDSIASNIAVALLCPLIAIILSEFIIQPLKQRVILQANQCIANQKGELNEEESQEKITLPKVARKQILAQIATITVILTIFMTAGIPLVNLLEAAKDSIWTQYEIETINICDITIDNDKYSSISSAKDSTLYSLLEKQKFYEEPFYFKSEYDSLASVISLCPMQQLNDTELLVDIQIVTIEIEPDGNKKELIFNNVVRLEYPITIDGEKVIRYSDDDISIEMTVITEKIEQVQQ